MKKSSVNPVIRAIYALPIDRMAAIVASQKNCRDVIFVEDPKDLVWAIKRLNRKRRLMDAVMGIHGKRQRKNMTAKFNAGSHRLSRPMRLVEEYVRIGQNIADLTARLKSLNYAAYGREPKFVRQRVGAMERAWKESHPGWIRDGETDNYISPTGESFIRQEVVWHVKRELMESQTHSTMRMPLDARHLLTSLETA